MRSCARRRPTIAGERTTPRQHAGGGIPLPCGGAPPTGSWSSPGTGRHALLEDSGSAIWYLLAEPTTQADLVAALTADVDGQVPADTGEQVATFLHTLADGGAAERR